MPLKVLETLPIETLEKTEGLPSKVNKCIPSLPILISFFFGLTFYNILN